MISASRDDKRDTMNREMRSSVREDRATMEAARWLVALEESPGDGALRARFEAWLEAPENAAAWAQTSDIYEMMGHVPRVPRVPRAQPVAAAPRASFRRRRWAVVAAAGLALAASLALFVVPDTVLWLQADHVTGTGELRVITLADGSEVRLGPDSALAASFRDTARDVKLLRGVAFFEVSRDPGRPFRVQAGRLETTVLGTQFDVRLGEAGTIVAVREGRVRVDQTSTEPPVSARLEAGDWVNVATNGHVEQRTVPPEQVAPWLQGQIIARDRRLGDVVEELRRYYGGAIVVTGGALEDRRVTGVYNLADPVAALRALAAAHGASVTKLSPWLLIVSGG